LLHDESQKFFIEGLDRFLRSEVICPSGWFVAAAIINPSLRDGANQSPPCRLAVARISSCDMGNIGRNPQGLVRAAIPPTFRRGAGATSRRVPEKAGFEMVKHVPEMERLFCSRPRPG
jgi:hypothetical protein